MYLQNHTCAKLARLKFILNGDHSHFKDVGSRSLYGGVDGVAFGHATHHRIAGVDVGQLAFTTKKRTHVAVFTSQSHTLLHITFHPRKTFELAVDYGLRLTPRNIEPLRQTEGGNAVNNAKIGGLGLPAHIAGDLLERQLKNACSGSGMDVLPPVKGSQHSFVLAQMRHQTQFHLRVVGTQKHMLCIGGRKSLTNLPPLLISNGNVLQVGIAAAESTSNHLRLIVTGMQEIG